MLSRRSHSSKVFQIPGARTPNIVEQPPRSRIFRSRSILLQHSHLLTREQSNRAVQSVLAWSTVEQCPFIKNCKFKLFSDFGALGLRCRRMQYNYSQDCRCRTIKCQDDHTGAPKRPRPLEKPLCVDAMISLTFTATNDACATKKRKQIICARRKIVRLGLAPSRNL